MRILSTTTIDFELGQLTEREGSFEIFGKVHAVVNSETRGAGLVLEHEKAMLPIIVKPGTASAKVGKLYRNDVVAAQVKIAKHEGRPPHLELSDDSPESIRVIDSISHCHGKEQTLVGQLVQFKKSPAITRDIYAVRVVDPNGIGRNFTFFPSPHNDGDFMEVFEELSDKAEAAWQASTCNSRQQ